MVREIRGIPPAPRRVAWRSVLGYRWPLAALAFVCAVYGGVVTWMLFLGQRDADPRLDRAVAVPADALPEPVLPAHKTTFPGEVVDVQPADRTSADGTPVDRVRYRFTYRGIADSGWSFAPSGSFAVGQAVTIEALVLEHTINRIVGTRRELQHTWLVPQSYLVAVLVPGLLFGLGWLASVFHLRHVLVHGDVGVARVLSVHPLRWLLPQMLAVRFEFRDRHAELRRSRHWVRRHSALGHRLATMPGHAEAQVPVLHDRRWPQHCRLVLPEGFLPARTGVEPTLHT